MSTEKEIRSASNAARALRVNARKALQFAADAIAAEIAKLDRGAHGDIASVDFAQTILADAASKCERHAHAVHRYCTAVANAPVPVLIASQFNYDLPTVQEDEQP